MLYLLDYSKLKTAEEATLLGKLKVRCSPRSFMLIKLCQYCAVDAPCRGQTAEQCWLVQDINPQLVARLSQRLFFVVNKIDLTRTSEGLEPDEIKHYVANLVTSQLATEGFQLSPNQVSCRACHLLTYLESCGT